VTHGTVEARGFDCVAVTATAGSSIFARVDLPDDPTCYFHNPVLQVYDPYGDIITSASATGPVYHPGCPSIDPTQNTTIRNRLPGRYVVCVLEGSRALLPNYLLTLGFLPTH
jgi:hypothetical protein